MFLRSLLYAILFPLWALPASLMIYIAAKLRGFSPLLSYWGKVWVTGNYVLEKYILGLDYNMAGWGNMPEGACIIAMQHQSEWETMKLFYWFKNPAIVLKAELLSIPLWGPAMKSYGAIAVARDGTASDLKNFLKAAKDRAAQGRPIIIYPEGTRTKPGERRELQRGFGVLYDSLKIPVVPVTLDSGIYWPSGAFVKKPGTIKVTVHPPIPPGLAREEMIKQVEGLFYG